MNAATHQDTWHVYQINDCDWYIGRTLDEASAAAAAECGLSVEEVMDDGHALTDAELDKLIFHDADGQTRTYREQLAKRLAEGVDKPGFFATTDY